MGGLVLSVWVPKASPGSNPSGNLTITLLTGSLVERDGWARWGSLGVVISGGSLQRRKRFFLRSGRGGGLLGVGLSSHSGESRWGTHLVTFSVVSHFSPPGVTLLVKLRNLFQRVYLQPVNSAN